MKMKADSNYIEHMRECAEERRSAAESAVDADLRRWILSRAADKCNTENPS